MADYEKYLKILKEHQHKVDFSQMLSRIEKKNQRETGLDPRSLKLAAAGTMATLLIGLLVYNIYFAWIYNGNYLSSYVFQDLGAQDNEIMAYVFFK